MLVGTGVDIVDIIRFKKICENPSFRNQYFHPNEQKIRVESLAGRFAAREALYKALDQQDIFNWKEILVVSQPGRAPKFEFLGALKEYAKDKNFYLSISHSQNFAVAFVVIETQFYTE
jgi:holo-[acyl-carrier protein] synthase